VHDGETDTRNLRQRLQRGGYEAIDVAQLRFGGGGYRGAKRERTRRAVAIRIPLTDDERRRRLEYVNEMAAKSSRLLPVVALFIVAPIGAAVVISVLLLFGATPHFVFLPGFVVKAKLASLGIRAPNAAGVLATLVFWWAVIVVVWLIVRRFTIRR
jgi:hypothetical protein